jgi:hypothetical protein
MTIMWIVRHPIAEGTILKSDHDYDSQQFSQVHYSQVPHLEPSQLNISLIQMKQGHIGHLWWPSGIPEQHSCLLSYMLENWEQ